MSFISAIGSQDASSKGMLLVDSLRNVGLSNAQKNFQVIENERTAAFSGILDAQGEFRLGIADMNVLECISADFIINSI